jgi:purine nucleosidase
MAPIATVIDTDPGVDDCIALLAALASPEIDLRAITVTHGNVELAPALENARRICALAGRADIPIHGGAARPLLRTPYRGKFHGKSGVGPLELPPPRIEASPEHAVTALARMLRAAARGEGPRLTICTIGPLTNVALALAQDPDLVGGVERIAMMGGAFRAGGNRTPSAEFNILADPHAARIVFASGAPIVMASLDVTHQAMATPARVEILGRIPGRVPAAVAELLAFFDRKDPARYGSQGAPLHDPTIIGWLARPALFQSRRAAVEICTDEGPAFGQTIADWWGVTGNPANAEILTGLDVDGFFAWLGDTLGRHT